MVSLCGDQESWRGRGVRGEDIEITGEEKKWNTGAHLEDFVVVRLEGVELDIKVSEIPQSHRLVSRACCHDELGVGVE